MASKSLLSIRVKEREIKWYKAKQKKKKEENALSSCVYSIEKVHLYLSTASIQVSLARKNKKA